MRGASIEVARLFRPRAYVPTPAPARHRCACGCALPCVACTAHAAYKHRQGTEREISTLKSPQNVNELDTRVTISLMRGLPVV